MKLYSGSGDDGTTGLFGGGRIRKDSLRIEAYGAVDELNAAIGLVAASCDVSRELHKRYIEIVTEIQSRLLDLGADLATPIDSEHEDKITRINSEHITKLEAMIDEIDAGNDSLSRMILPGGSELAVRLHLARTICRRSERRVLALDEEGVINRRTMVLLNRLSDLLFAMARRANKDMGVRETTWPDSATGPADTGEDL